MVKPEPEGFPEFWKIWLPIARHTDGRGLARETFRKHVEAGADAKDIIDGARWFVRNLTPRDKDGFVPLSSTWMNRESYLDCAERERQFQQRMAEYKAARQIDVDRAKAIVAERGNVRAIR